MRSADSFLKASKRSVLGTPGLFPVCGCVDSQSILKCSVPLGSMHCVVAGGHRLPKGHLSCCHHSLFVIRVIRSRHQCRTAYNRTARVSLGQKVRTCLVLHIQMFLTHRKKLQGGLAQVSDSECFTAFAFFTACSQWCMPKG